MKEQAIQKIEKEECKGPVAELQQMIMCWLAVDEKAAGLIMTEGKTIKGAYEAMRKEAEKIKSGMSACLEPSKAMAIVMEYFGMDKDSIQQELEGGLMYRIITEYSTRWKHTAHLWKFLQIRNRFRICQRKQKTRHSLWMIFLWRTCYERIAKDHEGAAPAFSSKNTKGYM